MVVSDTPHISTTCIWVSRARLRSCFNRGPVYSSVVAITLTQTVQQLSIQRKWKACNVIDFTNK